jgi:hypothetical protein
MREQKLREEEI